MGKAQVRTSVLRAKSGNRGARSVAQLVWGCVVYGKRRENCRPRLGFRALGLGLWDPGFDVAFAGRLLVGAPTQRLGER